LGLVVQKEDAKVAIANSETRGILAKTNHQLLTRRQKEVGLFFFALSRGILADVKGNIIALAVAEVYAPEIIEE
jgi:hypothetical protein